MKNSFQKEKKPEAEAPAVPKKDEEPVVAETAPIIPAVESTTPLEASIASPATVPTTTTEPTNGVETKAEAPAVKSEKRKSSLPFLSSSKKEKATSDSEGEAKPLSPFAKLRQTVKGKKTESKSPVEKTPEAAVAEPAVEAKKDEEVVPAVTEPKVEAAPPAATPQVATTA